MYKGRWQGQSGADILLDVVDAIHLETTVPLKNNKRAFYSLASVALTIKSVSVVERSIRDVFTIEREDDGSQGAD